jgi:LCP family protein required for cell wall assembly
MPRDQDEPQYTVYRSRPRLFGRKDAGEGRAAAGLQELRGEAPDAPRSPQTPPAYTKHGGGRRLRMPHPGGRRRRPGVPGKGLAGIAAGLTLGRVVKWLVVAVVAWVGFSLLLFLVSAQLERQNTSTAARNALDHAGYPLTSPNTVLILGSDARTKGLAEPGSTIGGPSRADSILLMRVGGGKSARLSIPRDTVVNIPGHGQDKINAAYAIGGPSLMIQTVKEYLGIDVNHLVEVNFENFPQFIDALGGVDVKTGCVLSKINGGKANGGTTLRLKRGENHLSGKQALALARTRKNLCNPAEDDLTRVKRQQQILSAIKGRLLGPHAFVRLPWVAWAAPKAIKSDMAGPSLLGVFGSVATQGNPPTRILRPSGGITLPDGGAGLVVSDAEKQREVRAFLKG